jgi:hypothetical protein
MRPQSQDARSGLKLDHNITRPAKFRKGRKASKVKMNMGKGFRARLFAWWYFAIGAGFFLLDIRGWLVGERIWLIILRLAISAGFLALGFGTWKSREQ